MRACGTGTRRSLPAGRAGGSRPAATAPHALRGDVEAERLCCVTGRWRRGSVPSTVWGASGGAGLEPHLAPGPVEEVSGA